MVLFIRIILNKETISYAKNPKPSVIISVKNGALCLAGNLPKVLSQDFIAEVVVMNDFSSDSSPEILDDLGHQNEHLHTHIPSKDVPGKKIALQEGINHATSSHLLLTDADCQPASQKWARIMAQKFSENTELVLGYGPLFREASFVNKFARFETLLTAIQYFGFALFKSPYMGVGRNMAFTKKLFDQVGGYRSHIDIPSGDDDLFVQSVAHKTETAICLDPQSFCYSKGPESWRSFKQQKTRHVATSHRYSTLHKILLSWHPLFHLLSFALSVFLILSAQFKFVILFFACRWIALIIFGYKPFKKLACLDLLPLIPILDLALIPYSLYFSLGAFFGSPQNARWQ